MDKKAFTTIFLAILALFVVGCKHRIEPIPEDTLYDGSNGDGRSGFMNPSRPGSGGGFDTLNPNSVGGAGFNSIDANGLESRDSFSGDGSADGFGGNLVRGQLPSVYFGFNQSFVAENERYKLKEVAEYLTSNPNSKMIIEGYCDWRGTTEYNMALGDRRARSCKQFLESLGVSSSSIEILSKGDQEAINGGTAAQMAEDRRAEFVIVKQ